MYQSRLDGVFALDRSSATSTVTRSVPGSTVHSKVDPGRAPRMAATASGMVVRTEGESGTVWRTLDRNVPTIFSASKSGLREDKTAGYGIDLCIRHSLKYSQSISQAVSQYRKRRGMNEADSRVTAVDEGRLTRAREIASRPEAIRMLGGSEWSVPSQSGSGRYRVTLYNGIHLCECKDFVDREKPCKHILAIMELTRPTPGPIPNPRPRKQ